MAVIREQLVLEDQFSQTFQSYIRLSAQAAGASNRTAVAAQNYESVLSRLGRRLIDVNVQFEAYLQEQAAVQAAGKESTAAFQGLDAKMEKLGATIRSLTEQYKAVEQQAAEAAEASGNFAAAEENTAEAVTHSAARTDALGKKLSELLGTYVNLKNVKSLFGLSDEMAATTVQLDRMNDGLQTTEELQDRIMAAAQRSRGSYQDAADQVATLGTQAGGAFSSSQEIVDFVEQVNKQTVLAGGAGAPEVMPQLTQAMASGALQGEEFDSILAQAPAIAQSIADYMGVPIETMRELASEGQITAAVVKNAMFAAAGETNEQFARMPTTWGQVWNQAQNVLLQTFQPVLDVVGQLAGWVGANMDTAVAAFYGLAAAVAIYTAAQWVATGAAQTFFATLLSNPILLAVAAGIGIVVALVYKFVQASGGLRIAWLRVCDALLVAWDAVKYGFMFGVYWVMNLWDTLTLKIATVSTSIANFMGDMKVSVLTILQNMINGGIDLLNDFIEFVNKIPGVALTPIEHVTFAADAAVENEAAKAARNADLANKQQEVERNKAERADALQQMWDTLESSHAARQAEIAEAMAEAAASQQTPDATEWSETPFDNEVPADVQEIKSGVGGIQKAVSAVGEDIKSLVDLAERRYINNINLNTPAPVITVQGANTGNTEADRRNMADAIRDILLEQTAAGAVRSTARVF